VLLPLLSFFLSFFPAFLLFFLCLNQILFCLKLTSVTYDKIARRTLLIFLSLSLLSIPLLFCACPLILCMFYGLFFFKYISFIRVFGDSGRGWSYHGSVRVGG
jgi:hypothetical protein